MWAQLKFFWLPFFILSLLLLYNPPLTGVWWYVPCCTLSVCRNSFVTVERRKFDRILPKINARALLLLVRALLFFPAVDLLTPCSTDYLHERKDSLPVPTLHWKHMALLLFFLPAWHLSSAPPAGWHSNWPHRKFFLLYLKIPLVSLYFDAIGIISILRHHLTTSLSPPLIPFYHLACPPLFVQ